VVFIKGRFKTVFNWRQEMPQEDLNLPHREWHS
jgi:hypothetical protein